MSWWLGGKPLKGRVFKASFYFNMKITTTLFSIGLIFLLSHRAAASPVVDAGLDAVVDSGLRLRLADDVQERRTTSLNWVDLRAVRYLSPIVAEPAEGPAPAIANRLNDSASTKGIQSGSATSEAWGKDW